MNDLVRARERSERPGAAPPEGENTIRILVAESVPLLRGGLVALLNGVPGLKVVAELGAGLRMAPLGRLYRPDVALVDVDLPDLDGFAAARRLREAVPDCPVILLTAHRRAGALRRAAEARAAGLLAKDTSPDALVGAIRQVAAGRRVVDPDLAFGELDAGEGPLTEREREVLALAAQGATAAQIAEELVLTIGTVRNHLSRINRKIGARNRVHAIRIAEEAGWL
ncbi:MULTISPECIES: response regulator transcription factor [Actinomadura]|uniref:Response regulator transcription factor n=1 Tax=Actinomadura miaoliensis TaxID=430685 RepID=A0ABP7VTZ7_9ACTN